MTKPKPHVKNSVRKEYSACLDGVVDMELDCVTCGTRLYVPEALIDTVLGSLEQTGAAILICATCNQGQLIRWKVPRSRDLHA